MSTINLLPEDYLTRRYQNRANTVCIILFSVVMAGVGAATLVSERNSWRTRQVRDRVNASYAEAAKLLTQMQKLEATRRQMVKKAKSTASLLERVPRSYLLATLARALPSHCALAKVELSMARPKRHRTVAKGKKFAAIKKNKARAKAKNSMPPMALAVTGLAATDVEVGEFITNLNANPLLMSVDLDYSQEKVLRTGKDSKHQLRVREFKVTMELRPDVDVIDLVKPEVANGGAGGSTGQAIGADS